jgi:hypothetical protein
MAVGEARRRAGPAAAARPARTAAAAADGILAVRLRPQTLVCHRLEIAEGDFC